MNNAYDINNIATIFGSMSFDDTMDVLEKYGVNVHDADGNFRCLSDIFDNISEVWRRIVNSSARFELSEASQSLIFNSKNANLSDNDNTILDDFLKQFERSNEYANKRQRLDGHD